MAMLKMDIQDNIAIVTIDNPPMNVLCSALLEELNDVIDQLESSNVKAAILTGEGKAFVAGADIKEMMDMDTPQATEFAKKGQGVFTRLESSKVIFIAAVNGFALGGGTELSLACDFVLASEKAKFGQPEVNLGVIPGFGGTQRLPRAVGPKMAKELIYTGNIIGAEEAMRIGLANHVYPMDPLLEEAKKMATLIASKGPVAVQESKRSIREGLETSQSKGMGIEADAFAGLFSGHDQKEGMKAFVEKRKPDFKGQ